jgi:hypothetical protein
MSKLNKFNNLYSKIISEMTNSRLDDKDINEKNYTTAFISSIHRTDDFYNAYIANNALKSKIFAGKDGENFFILFGYLKNIKDFLKSFKVDNEFIEKPENFEVFGPMYTLDDDKYAELLHTGDCEYFVPESNNTPCLNELSNIMRRIPRGRWYDIKQSIKNEASGVEIPYKIKSISPIDLSKTLDEIITDRDKAFFVKFGVNCEGLSNINYDQNSMWKKY